MHLHVRTLYCTGSKSIRRTHRPRVAPLLTYIRGQAGYSASDRFDDDTRSGTKRHPGCICIAGQGHGHCTGRRTRIHACIGHILRTATVSAALHLHACSLRLQAGRYPIQLSTRATRRGRLDRSAPARVVGWVGYGWVGACWGPRSVRARRGRHAVHALHGAP